MNKPESGFCAREGDYQYVFGGRIIITSFFIEGIGGVCIRAAKESAEIGVDVTAVPQEGLYDESTPETMLVFANPESIDVLVGQLTEMKEKLITSQLNKTDESKND